jgi:flagellin-like hook-associated protein FlgL
VVTQAQQTSDPTVRANLAAQYNEIRNQIDQLAADSGINGINLLAGNDLSITLNESGTSTVTISGFDDTSAGALGLAASANNWSSDADIATSASDLTAALVTLRSQSQALSSNLQAVQIRQDFTKAMINTLTTGADGLTLADSNEEGANLLALQTRQQLSTTALSLAAQADQNVLKLFS